MSNTIVSNVLPIPKMKLKKQGALELFKKMVKAANPDLPEDFPWEHFVVTISNTLGYTSKSQWDNSKVQDAILAKKKAIYDNTEDKSTLYFQDNDDSDYKKLIFDKPHYLMLIKDGEKVRLKDNWDGMIFTINNQPTVEDVLEKCGLKEQTIFDYSLLQDFQTLMSTVLPYSRLHYKDVSANEVNITVALKEEYMFNLGPFVPTDENPFDDGNMRDGCWYFVQNAPKAERTVFRFIKDFKGKEIDQSTMNNGLDYNDILNEIYTPVE